MELITHLSFDTFFSARATLLKEIFENESTPVSIHVLNEDESFVYKALARRNDTLLWGLIKFGVAHWPLCGLQHTQALLFSEGKLVVGMMSP